MTHLVSALFVETGGCYFGLPHVDPWDEQRDARHMLVRVPLLPTLRVSAGVVSGMAPRASRTSSSLVTTKGASRPLSPVCEPLAAFWSTRPIATHGGISE